MYKLSIVEFIRVVLGEGLFYLEDAPPPDPSHGGELDETNKTKQINK
jgi:hypothetical protein